MIRFKPLSRYEPNKLDPARDQYLRSSSWKFSEVKVPEFLSESKASFIEQKGNSPPLTVSQLHFQKNVEKNIFKPTQGREAYIFGARLTPTTTSNQAMFHNHPNSHPNTLG